MEDYIDKLHQARSWDAAVDALKRAKQALGPQQLEKFIAQVADMSAAEMVEISGEGPEGSRPTNLMESKGVQLNPAQVERFATWQSVQKEAATALGLSKTRWAGYVKAAFSRLEKPMPVREPEPKWPFDVSYAKLLGKRLDFASSFNRTKPRRS